LVTVLNRKRQCSTGKYAVEFQSVVPTETDALALATSTTNAAASNGTAVNDVLTITIANGYPGYVGTATFNIKNSGTVPVKITGVTVTDLAGVATIAKTGFAVNDVIAAGAQITGATVSVTINTNATQSVTGVDTVIIAITTEQGI